MVNYLEHELSSLKLDERYHGETIDRTLLDGIWYLDLENPLQEWFSPKFWTSLGFTPDQKAYTPESWEILVVPEDLQRIKLKFKDYLARESDASQFEAIIRFKNISDELIPVLCRGSLIEVDGRKRVIGTHINLKNALSDYTEKAHTINRFQFLLDELIGRANWKFILFIISWALIVIFI